MLCEKVNGVPRGLKQDFVQFGMSFLHRGDSPELVMPKIHDAMQKCEK
jgi:hypothetical protein